MISNSITSFYRKSDNPKRIKYFILLLFVWTFVPWTSAQNFNYQYINSSGNSIVSGKGNSIVELPDDCGVAMVNSLFLDNSTTDIQVTFVKPTGDLIGSYTFGDDLGSEYGHGICKSIDFADQFLVCGKSGNNQMLLLKIDINGNLIWSKEITFSGQDVEGVNIFQVNNNYNDRGYIVVGNSNSTNGTNSVAAAKIDENGNVIWSAEYNMGVKLQMTDAIARSQYSDRIFSVVGYVQFGGIFYLNVYAATGNVFYYPGANFALNNPEPLLNPQITEVTEGTSKTTAISFMRNAMSANSIGAYMFGFEGYSDFSPIWAKHYEQVGVHGYINSDLITTSSNQIALLGSVNTDITFGGSFLITTAHPYVLNTDFNGNLLSTRDYNYANDPIEYSTSLMESCNSGEVTFNSAVLDYGVNWNLRLVKQDSPGYVDCSEQFDWWEVGEDMIKSPINMVEIFNGTVANYPIQVLDQSLDKFDCFGGMIMRPSQAGDGVGENYFNQISIQKPLSNTEWFSPNPATNLLQLNLPVDQAKIDLYAINGELIYSFLATSTQAQLNISAFEKGVYFVVMTASNSDVLVEKLIIH